MMEIEGIRRYLHEQADTVSGERKMELLSDYLSDQGWLQVFLPFLLVDEDGWLKGDIVIAVDEIGIWAWKNRHSHWERLGGAAFPEGNNKLSAQSLFGNLPEVTLGGGSYTINIDTGKDTALPEEMWDKPTRIPWK